MNLFRRHRFLKFVTGAVIIGAPTYGYLKHQGINKDYLLLTLGPVRFGRAAMAGASIVLDYKVKNKIKIVIIGDKIIININNKVINNNTKIYNICYSNI